MVSVVVCGQSIISSNRNCPGVVSEEAPARPADMALRDKQKTFDLSRTVPATIAAT
jgi:hypothetical protein